MREQILGLITPLMALIFFSVFLLLWRRGKMGSYVLAFAGAYLFFGLGFVATHLLPDTGAFYVFHLTQLFYTAGSVCVIWGATRRVNQHVSLPVLGLVYVLTALTLAVAVGMSDETGPRLYIVNTGYGVMFTIGTMALLQAPRRSALDKLVTVLFAISAAQFFIRPALTLLIAGGSAASDYRESIYYSVLSVAVTIQSLATAVCLIWACAWDLIQGERERAQRDVLTGLRSRRAFEQDALSTIERAKQEGVPIAIVVADIDHFKSVNDVYGHQVGDKAIAIFGSVVDGMIRHSDIAGRIGGEEFCIIAWNCDAASAKTMADRIRRRFADTRIAGMPDDTRLTASFGVAARREGEGYGKLFARADAELYRAKESGRDRVCLPERENNLARLPLDREVRTASA
ncbi:GGDEF domain-containing protein [Qipengyuania soli]|uniref:diguanylate cyclase n=1 Tax=Qipengyuania soli TaxID=2782568 RepID=A0A7S8IVA8_9SPHN|nr:GGDEF domain-containing protein [Qipengyuania soli]QPC99647.1 diguanylate cyclase [Qipengyuania soli]